MHLNICAIQGRKVYITCVFISPTGCTYGFMHD